MIDYEERLREIDAEFQRKDAILRRRAAHHERWFWFWQILGLSIALWALFREIVS